MFHVKHSADTAPAAAAEIFGAGLSRICTYHEILASAGVERGLLGPREVPRLWDRHILNSAVIAELIPAGSAIADIGTGAGLPGIPLAVARPDLRVLLVEPLLRRSEFLEEVVNELGLNAEVVRGRAEESTVRERLGEVSVVTSRAVASLEKLGAWSLPLLSVGGVMLAIKGERAAEEVDEHREALTSLGAGEIRVVQCGAGAVEPPTTVVVAVKARTVPPPRKGKRQHTKRRPA